MSYRKDVDALVKQFNRIGRGDSLDAVDAAAISAIGRCLVISGHDTAKAEEMALKVFARAICAMRTAYPGGDDVRS